MQWTPFGRACAAVGLFAVTALSGCTTTVYSSQAGAAAVAPQLTVERFLEASNVRDVDAMSRLFGTADGAIGDTGSTFGCFFKKIGSLFGGTSCRSRADVEVQLDAIARILRHNDYVVTGEEPVPGRSHPTRRVFVNLKQGSAEVRALPFTVVRSDGGRWFIEQVDLERVMRQGR